MVAVAVVAVAAAAAALAEVVALGGLGEERGSCALASCFRSRRQGRIIFSILASTERVSRVHRHALSKHSVKKRKRRNGSLHYPSIFRPITYTKHLIRLQQSSRRSYYSGRIFFCGRAQRLPKSYGSRIGAFPRDCCDRVTGHYCGQTQSGGRERSS